MVGLAEKISELWQERSENKPITQGLIAQGTHPIVASLLARRGFEDIEQALIFLNPNFSLLLPPDQLRGMQAAVERLSHAILQKQKIVIYGDYDVDGITATTLLYLVLQAMQAQVDYYIPNRFREGYGLNTQAMQHIRESGADVVITVDSGITAHDTIQAANDIGLDVIVTDHHQASDTLPPAYAILNPHQPGCDFGFKSLCGVGVAFYLAIGLRAKLRDIQWPHIPVLRHYLDLVALGTMADIVSLTGPNRVFVRMGLEEMRSHPRPGIQALMQLSMLTARNLQVRDLSFRFAPMINAGGRLEDAALSAKLLSASDAQTAQSLAQELSAMNEKRKGLEQTMTKAALQQVDELYAADLPAILVLSSPDWHEGVIGIVAARVAERLERPAIILAELGDRAKGSARSYNGINIHQALSQCSHLMQSFGGHPNAAGLSIDIDKITELRQAVNHAAAQLDQPKEQAPIWTDGDMDFEQLNFELLKQIEKLEPFGTDNPDPIFIARGVELSDMKTIKKQHVQVQVKQGDYSFKAFGFHMAHRNMPQNQLLDIAYTPELNNWRGRSSIRLLLKDFKIL